MANEYYERLSQMNPGDLADGLAMEAEFDAISQGFSKLPTPHTGGNGFDGPVRVGEAVNADEAVNLRQLNATIGEAKLLPIATYGDLNAAAWGALASSDYLLFGPGAQFSNFPAALVAGSTYFVHVRHVVGGAGVSLYCDKLTFASVDDAGNVDINREFSRLGSTLAAANTAGWKSFALKTGGVAPLEALTPAADRFPYYTGAGVAALGVMQAFGRSLVGSASGAEAKAILGLDGLSGRNKIINGKMEIAQRGTSFPAAADGVYPVDRFKFRQSSSAVVTASQQLDGPLGFKKSLRIEVTAADTSIAAGDFAILEHIVEGYNVADLVGTTFCLSFWVRSSKTGIHTVALRNSGANRSFIAEYVVAAANTWEKKVVVVPNGIPSSGTWDFTNGVGLNINFALAGGSSFANASTDTWLGLSAWTTANQVNCLDTVGNIFAITGVQLEEGSVATPFEHRLHGQELAMCQRYYVGHMEYNGTQNDAYWSSFNIPLAAAMRTPPTITTGVLQNPSTGTIIASAGAWTMSILGGSAGQVSINGKPNTPGVGGWIKAILASMSAEL